MNTICSKLNACVDQPDLAKLLLRLAVAILLAMHGLDKIQSGLGGVEGTLGKIGLPTFLAPTIYLGEIVAPVLLVLGIWVRPAALVIFLTMLVAWLGMFGAGIAFKVNPVAHGALLFEGLYFYLAVSLALIFIGGGKYSVVSQRWR